MLSAHAISTPGGSSRGTHYLLLNHLNYKHFSLKTKESQQESVDGSARLCFYHQGKWPDTQQWDGSKSPCRGRHIPLQSGLRPCGEKGLGMDLAMARSTHSMRRRGRRVGSLAFPGSFRNPGVLPRMLLWRGAKGFKRP